MKKLFTFAAILLFVVASNAQFKVGKNTAGIIVGYGGGGFSGNMKIPPIGIEYNFLNFGDNIQAGIYAGYASYGDEASFGTTTWSFTYSHIIIVAQGNYHFSPGEKFDPFAGLSLGYDIGSAKTEVTGPGAGFFTPAAATVGGIIISGQAGFNYWFSPGTALQLRVGYFPYVAIGLTFGM